MAPIITLGVASLGGGAFLEWVWRKCFTVGVGFEVFMLIIPPSVSTNFLLPSFQGIRSLSSSTRLDSVLSTLMIMDWTSETLNMLPQLNEYLYKVFDIHGVFTQKWKHWETSWLLPRLRHWCDSPENAFLFVCFLE